MEKGNLIADMSKDNIHFLKKCKKNHRLYGSIYLLGSIFFLTCVIISPNEPGTIILLPAFTFFCGEGIIRILRSNTITNMNLYENGFFLPETYILPKVFKGEKDFIKFTDIEQIYLNKKPKLKYVTIKKKNSIYLYIRKEFFDVEAFNIIVSNKLKISFETVRIPYQGKFFKEFFNNLNY